MNKAAIRVIISVLVILLFIPCTGYAQDNEEPNTVLIFKQALDPNAVGTPAEADSLFALFDKNVTKKNKYVKMHIRVSHYYGSDSQDALTIIEFNGSGLDIIDKSREEQSRLFKEWKKDEEDRKAFNEALNKYFKSGHSDEIYQLFTKVTN